MIQEMNASVRHRANPVVTARGIAGGVLALLVSVGLAVTLPMRDVDYNALNLFTIILASAAGILAIIGARRADGRGLGWGLSLLFIAIVPTVYGWVILLYLPALALLFAAAVNFISLREDPS